MRISGLGIVFVATLALAGQAPKNPPGQPGDAGATPVLETEATAVIAARCLACHGAERPTAGLSLATLAGALKGGSRGAALVAGQPDRSLLVTRVEGEEMPPVFARSARSVWNPGVAS